MLRLKKRSKKYLLAVLLGLIIFFFIDDFLLVILANHLGFLQNNRWLFSAVLIWLFLASTGLAFAALKAKQNKVITGGEGLLEELGVIISNSNSDYRVKIHGEIWNANSNDGVKLHVDDRIKVVAVDGLTLIVEKT